MQELAVYCAEFENDMPLNEADRAWIRQEIQAAHKRHGLGKLTGFIKDWSGTGAAAAILILAFTQWNGYVEFRTQTNYRLKDIEKKLSISEIQTHLSMPQSVFETTLPDLKGAITTARKEDARVSPKVIEDLRGKLLSTSSDAQEFWPTVSEFISYRSLVGSASPEQAKKLLTERVPDCTDSPPKPMTIKEVLNPKEAITSPGLYENCRFVIDSPVQDQRVNEILKGDIPNLKFKDCLLEYHGGEINLIVAWDKIPSTWTIPGRTPEDKTKTLHVTMSGPTIEFENCLLNFSFQGAPPPKGQQLSTTLLAQNVGSISLPISR